MAVAIAAACDWTGGQSNENTPSPSIAPSAPSVAGYHLYEPGALIAEFPADPLDMQSEPLIGYGSDLAIGANGNEIYVLDTYAKHVLSLDGDANLRAIIGGRGGGPGEFEDPYSIEADPRGGVWVSDLRLARMSRFDANGNLLEELRVPELVRGFTVLPNGAVLYRQFDGETVSLTMQAGEDAVDFAGELPPELAPDNFPALWAEYDLEFAAVTLDTVVAFRNTDVRAYGAWRIALDIPAGRITDVEPVSFPAWLTDAVAADAEAVERDRGEGETTQTIPFSRGVRMGSGGLWVAPASTAHLTLATTIPLTPNDSVSVVARWPEPPASDCFGLDYAVAGGRLIQLCMTQVRVYEVRPAAPELLPFTARSR
jgi:hypothetical protein